MVKYVAVHVYLYL